MGAIIGKCRECPKDAKDVRLYAINENGNGVCDHHLHNPNDKVERSVAVSKEDKKNQEDKEMKAWFAMQLKQQPVNCENCGKKIRIPANLPKSTSVCHIVPKAKVKSVRTHPNNCWFGDCDCHTQYDKAGHAEAAKMPVAKIAIARFKTFAHLIDPKELKHVQPWLLKAVEK